MRISTFVRTVACVAVGVTACAAACSQGPTGSGAPLSPDLSCARTTNCVSSLGNDPAPFKFDGTAERGLALLRATLASFPEATIVRAEGLAIEVIFTTRMGFQDQVDFRVDPQGGRIDYRSRSLFGLFDWGKNRSRMEAVGERFKQQVPRR